MSLQGKNTLNKRQLGGDSGSRTNDAYLVNTTPWSGLGMALVSLFGLFLNCAITQSLKLSVQNKSPFFTSYCLS